MTRLWSTFLTVMLMVAFGFGQAPRPCTAAAGTAVCAVSLCSCHADKDHELRATLAAHQCLVPDSDFAQARPASGPVVGCAAHSGAGDLAPPSAAHALPAPRAPGIWRRVWAERTATSLSAQTQHPQLQDRPPRLAA